MAAKTAFGKAIVVRAPQPKAPIIRISQPAMQKAKKVASHFGRAAFERAKQEKHTMGAVLAGAALGFAERQKVQLPHFSTLGVAGTYGVAAWFGAKHLRSRTLSHVATGLLTIAAYQFARGEGVSGIAGPTILPLA